MRLAQLSIPRLITYTHASHLQELLTQRHFRYKALLRSTPTPPTPPSPTVLTFSTRPTYTVGRRYLPYTTRDTTNPSSQAKEHKYIITPAQIAHLTHSALATFHTTPRGGDLTYHGPGQLTAYPILDLRTHNITPRNYIRLLETTVINTCTSLGVLHTHTTSDPGVWLSPNVTAGLPERKICAIGVQIRRGITGHGIGFNVADVPLGPEYVNDDGNQAEGALSWGFERIVACGLEGRGVTWLAREGARSDLTVEEVGQVFTRHLAKELGIEDTYEINEAELPSDEEPEKTI